MANKTTTSDAQTLADIRSAARDASDLAAGGFVVAAMSPSGRVKTESVTRWHLAGDPGDLWGIAYKVANHASDYQRDGAVCGFARGYDDAQARIADLATIGSNGKQTIVAGSLVAVPAYIVHRDHLGVLTDALKATYAAWLDAPVTAPVKRSRGRKAS